MEDSVSQNDILLHKVREDITRNLDNEQYSVETLARNIGLSRSMLHRKLVKTIGKSAGDLITETRLEHAKKLLEENTCTVSEIAYKVGFRTPSYFNKVFKDYYHVPPGELKKNTNVLSDPTDKQVPSDKEQKQSSKNKKNLYAISLLTIIAFTIASFILYKALTPTKTEEKSIAVLPLNNMTGMDNTDYFVDGMHDALIGELGKISSIRVISRTSTLRYRNSDMLLKDIANELGVDCIVEGSVICLGDSLCILIQLIDVFPEERHLLADEYNDLMPNALLVQSSMAQDIAKKIDVKLTKEERQVLSSFRTVDPETYKSYLRGMYYLHQGTKEGFHQGIEQLRLAIDRDPADPFAYAGLALGYSIMGHGQLESEEAFLSAMSSAEKAIRLDPTIDEAYNALAILYLYSTWDWEKAKKAFENNILHNPNNAIAHAHFAWYHVLFHDREKCLYHAKRATLLEPLSAAYHSWLALLYFHYKEYEQAEASAQRALELKENNPYGNLIMGRVRLIQNKFDEAIAYQQKLPKRLYWETELGYTYTKIGQRDKAMEIWNKYYEISHKKKLNPCHMGKMAAYLGFTDKAFDFLNKAIEEKSYPITYLDFYPYTENINHDPRYADLFRKMNLPNNKYLITQNQ